MVVIVNKEYFKDLELKSKAFELSCSELEKIGKSAEKQNAIVELHKDSKWKDILIKKAKEILWD